MAGKEVVLMGAWKEWGIQVLVLLSLALQVVLLVLAKFRRHVRSATLMLFVWSAYMLADATAIYVLGHMSVINRSPEHQLVAFWPPFLLLHLGGQDNITAYAIEDNRLWLRHLQTLAVQAAAAAYILSQSPIITGDEQPLLRWATIILFVVGVAKYGERVWALWSANTSSMVNNYHDTSAVQNNMTGRFRSKASDTEAHLRMAHYMLDVPKSLLKESVPADRERYHLHGLSLYKMVEMQLSLMHDMFYTKTFLIHSNWDLTFIHKISAVAATATALVLFHRVAVWDDKGYNRMDVAVTYVLLVGAVIMETLSFLRTTFSSWTYGAHKGRSVHMFGSVQRLVLSVRRLVHAADWRPRYWSASMGQHNLLQLSVRSRASLCSKIASLLGYEDLWNTHAYSWSIPVLAFIEESLVNQLSFRSSLSEKRGGRDEEEGQIGTDGDWEDEAQIKKIWVIKDGQQDQYLDPSDVFDSRVPTKLKRWGLYKAGLTKSVEERILIWHIATNIYLTWWYKEHGEKRKEENVNDKKQKITAAAKKADAYKVEHSKQASAEATEALSNYMVFLLASRPGMMSPTSSRRMYLHMCFTLVTKGPPCETAEELAGKLWSYGDEMLNSPQISRVKPDEFGFDTPRDINKVVIINPNSGEERSAGRYRRPMILQIGCMLGAMLIKKDATHTMDMIAQAWLETLFYAARDCSAYAHAKQLSNGSELITIAAILAEYFKRDAIDSLDGPQSHQPSSSSSP